MASLPNLAAAAAVHPHAALLTQAQLAARPAVTTASVAAAAAAQQQAQAQAQQQQQQQQQQGQPRPAAAAAAADTAAKKVVSKKRKPQEKSSGEKPLQLVPESALFNSLVMQERELDYQIRRRRLEVQAAALPYDHPVPKRLRVYVYTTHANQPAAAGVAAAAAAAAPPQGGGVAAKEPAQWTLWLWGRLVDPSDPPPPPGSAADALAAAAAASVQLHAPPPGAAGAGAGAAAGHATGHKHHALTSFFRRISVQLDPQQYPDDAGLFVWDKFHHRGPHKDRVEIRRPGSSNVAATITLEQEFVPPAYKLAPGLAELVGVTFGQQNSVLARVWTYIHKHKPQDDPSVLQLDAKLAALVGAESLPREHLPGAVGKLLSPMDPIVLDYTIDVTGPSPGAVTCLDVDVLLPAKLQDKAVPGMDALMEEKQFEAMDHKLAGQLAKLYEARRRRALYLGFAESPVDFINATIAAQARELRIGRGGAAELERRSEAFAEKWVEEAAAKYLAKRNGMQGLF